jgi:hydrogenase/urease accessory protein HupE
MGVFSSEWPSAPAMLACALVLTSFYVPTASAHPLAPSLIRIEEHAPGLVHVTWKTPKLKVPGSKLEPVLPDHCKSLSQPELHDQGAARIYTWRMDCGERGLTNALIGADGIAESRTDVIVHIELLDGRTYRSILTADEPRWSVPEVQSKRDVFTSYAQLGFAHILSGFDHLTFVFGLMLLVSLRRLFWVVTAFTLGHSITLALSALDLVRVPQRPVEILIALSIGVVAWEVLRGANTERTSFTKLPVMMAATFGLLHGLGFASALRELGLPQGAIPLSLFSFNVGIEVGQLAFIAVVLIPVALVSSSESSSRTFRIVSAYVIGSLAFYWAFSRALT